MRFKCMRLNLKQTLSFLYLSTRCTDLDTSVSTMDSNGKCYPGSILATGTPKAPDFRGSSGRDSRSIRVCVS